MGKELILIVEDVDLLRDGLCETLTGEGYEVLTARNGREALEKMYQSLPELIISDITMPVMDGFAFYNAVRARPEWVSIPFIFLSARTEMADFITGRNLGVDDYLTKPITQEELITTVRSRLSRFRQAQVGRVQQAYLDSLIALANAIEYRSPNAGRHIERITGLALLFAERLDWQPNHRTNLRFAAILHDIGKIHVPASVLFKPGPLTETEWEVIRRHPLTGADMLKDVDYLIDCIPMVRHHHERWDGQGYPDGLVGLDIPAGARIIAVVDSLEAMISERPYAPARTLNAACDEIFELAGKNYDPELAEIVWDAGIDGSLEQVIQRSNRRGSSV